MKIEQILGIEGKTMSDKGCKVETKATLQQIFDNKPCKAGWERILQDTGKSSPDNTEIDFHYVLRNGNIEDAIWGLTCLGYEVHAPFTASLLSPMLSRFVYPQYVAEMKEAVASVEAYCKGGLSELGITRKSSRMKVISKDLIGMRKWLSDPMERCEHDASVALALAIRFLCKPSAPADMAMKLCARSAAAFVCKQFAGDPEEYKKVYPGAVRKFWLIVRDQAEKWYQSA